MKILLVTPWARALSRVFCDELAAEGHDVRLVTTTWHFERLDPRAYELIIPGSLRRPSSWAGSATMVAEARRFRPDVVLAEPFVDPRLLPLLSLAPLATIVHDDVPHDSTHVEPLRKRIVRDRAVHRADVLVTFSNYVASRLRDRGATQVATVPLPSEASEGQVPPFVPAVGRRDVVLIGRIRPYKNLAGTFDGWARHVRSTSYGGDRLLVMGDGAYDGPLPPNCDWRRGRFQFSELLPVLAAAKASLAYYSTASQSGVQVLSMQCGTPVVASDAGGLPEFLPSGEHAVPRHAPGLLAEALDGLTDPNVVAQRGAAALTHYRSRFHPAVAVPALLEVLERLRAGGFSTLTRR